jgi:hypothetical protein
MLSPAEFVWMIRSLGFGAADTEKNAAQKAIPLTTMRQPRNTYLFIIFVAPLFDDKQS